MLNPLAELNLLNQAGAGAPGLQVPTGFEGAALNRVAGLSAVNPLLGAAELDKLEVLGQGNLALGGMMEWLGEEATLANQVNQLQGGANLANAAGGGTPAVDAIGAAGSAPSAGASGSTPGAGAGGAGGASGPGSMQNPQDAGAGAAEGGTGEWGPEDEKFLEQDVQKNQGGGSSGGPGAGAGGDNSGEFNELFKDFGQTSEGNCATVAVMKAALDKYGTKVFESVQKSGDGYTVKQQDGKSVTVSSGELKQAAQAAKLKGKPSAAKSMAVLMYAVVGKNSGGVDKLGHGADPKEIAKSLGLGNKIKEVSPDEAAKSNSGAVAWNGTHAVYEDNGKADHYGQAQTADGTDTRGGRLTQAFEFA